MRLVLTRGIELTYKFGPYEFSESNRVLLRKGVLVQLEPRLAALLSLLLRRSGRIVRRSEIISEVWGGRAISEGSVGVAIAGLRKVLGDNPTRARMIRTVYGRGYSFVAEVVSVTHPDSPGATDTPVLVGRSAEIASLLETVSRAKRGELTLSAITGEPGIGKSKLLATVCHLARSRRFHVHELRCESADNHFPSLRQQMVQQLSSSLLMPPDRSRSHDPVDHLGDRNLSPSSVRHRRFEEIATSYARLAVGNPVVLAIDDLHLADRLSLDLLRYLALALRGSCVAIVATYRDTELTERRGLLEALSRLSQDSLLQRVNLQGLSEAEIGQLVLVKTGVRPNQRLLTRLSSTTKGNPLFLLSVLSSPAFSDTSEAPDSEAPMPTDISAAVTAHVSALAPRSLETLSAASILGYSFRTSLLSDSLNRRIGEIREDILSAVQKRILYSCDAIDETFEFTHPLVRDALYSLTAFPFRCRIHQRAATALKSSSGRRLTDDRVPELATHLFNARDPTAIPLLLRAGEIQEASFEFEKAAQQYIAALQLSDVLAPLADPERFVAVVSIGRCLVQGGDRKEASKFFRKATTIAQQLRFTDHIARETLRACPDFFSIECGVVDAALVELLEETFRGIQDSNDLELKALVGARLVLAKLWSDFHQGSVKNLVEFLNYAKEQVSTPSIRVAVMPAVWRAQWGPETLDERLEIGDWIDAHRFESADVSLVHRLYYISGLLEAGDLAAFDAQVHDFWEIAESVRHPQGLWYSEMFRATRSLLVGDFDRAESQRERFSRLARLGMDANGIHTAALHEFLLLWEKRRLEELISKAERTSIRYPNVPGWRAILAFSYLETGRRADGEREFESLRRRGFSSIPNRIDWPSTFALGLAQACARIGDGDAARDIYQRLVRIRGREVIAGIGAMACGCVDRYLGLLARTIGANDTAEEHFRSAIDFDREIGAKPWVAHAEFDLAKLLRSRRKVIEAKRYAVRALMTAQELGMDNLKAKIGTFNRQLSRT